MAYIAKALVPVVMGFLVIVLEPFGITPDTTIETAVMLLLTGAMVFFVPNKVD